MVPRTGWPVRLVGTSLELTANHIAELAGKACLLPLVSQRFFSSLLLAGLFPIVLSALETPEGAIPQGTSSPLLPFDFSFLLGQAAAGHRGDLFHVYPTP